ncbi:MAG TPA: dNTP triphosphohydrolase [Chitinophagaceae bacterium]|nr:dNTP triphosphohydrolase [Chitinophagaceae bacterium]
MDFQTIFTSKRVGSEKSSLGPRSGFQRDFDRLIFSSPFRRLQNKTQVFPLPGIAFVHNRLTHSLEVASVGRSLGQMTGREIAQQYKSNEEVYEFYKYELSNVVGAACIAHDVGNPAFGHSGEKAIATYFIENAEEKIDQSTLSSYFNDREWKDITNFEGNANALRILTHSFKGRFKGGLGLTYTTIAAMLKYPCESLAVNKSFKHRSKYGFFQTEKEVVKAIADELGLIQEKDDPIIYKRHPFVYLVEAADDICYSIIDMEDAQRLKIISTERVREAFFDVLRSINRKEENLDRIRSNYAAIGDINEGIAYLRAKTINALTMQAAEVFLDNKENILAGNYNNSLVDHIEEQCGALKEVKTISKNEIYNHPIVMQIEIAGYNVMSDLLQLFIPALLRNKPSHKDQKILNLFPDQFTEYKETDSKYLRVMSALDFLSGMTDVFATEIYRRLKGIVIPEHG